MTFKFSGYTETSPSDYLSEANTRLNNKIQEIDNSSNTGISEDTLMFIYFLAVFIIGGLLIIMLTAYIKTNKQKIKNSIKNNFVSIKLKRKKLELELQKKEDEEKIKELEKKLGKNK